MTLDEWISAATGLPTLREPPTREYQNAFTGKLVRRSAPRGAYEVVVGDACGSIAWNDDWVPSGELHVYGDDPPDPRLVRVIETIADRLGATIDWGGTRGERPTMVTR